MKEVLDTRLLLAHFAPEDEAMGKRTRERFHALRRSGGGLLPVLVLAEFFQQVCQRAGAAEATAACEALAHGGLKILPLTAEVAMAAGRLRCSHRRVPLGDCIVAAEAVRQEARVISDDPHFREIRGIRTAWI